MSNISPASRSVWCLALVCCVLNHQPLMAVEQVGPPDPSTNARLRQLDAQLQAIYQHAAQAMADKNVRQADFWLARYLGLTTFSEDRAHSPNDLIPLFEQRRDLVPTAFMSGRYAEGFLQFFAQGGYALWAVPEARANAADATYAIRTYADARYFVELIASPRLEAWTIIGDHPGETVIPLVAATPPAVLMAGTLDGGKPARSFPRVALNTEGDGLQYVWPIEAHDLDGDGIPEIWLRYNQAWADGFSQVLAIYKIEQNAALVLFKRFEGHAEGIARRVADGTIEVAEGFAQHEGTGHLGFDRHHIETFVFQDGAFVKTAERDVPHLLWGEDWRSYYFGSSDRQTVLESRQ